MFNVNTLFIFFIFFSFFLCCLPTFFCLLSDYIISLFCVVVNIFMLNTNIFTCFVSNMLQVDGKHREKIENCFRVKLLFTYNLCVYTYILIYLHINYVYFFIFLENRFAHFPSVYLPHKQLFVFLFFYFMLIYNKL